MTEGHPIVQFGTSRFLQAHVTVLHPSDNVAVARVTLSAGMVVGRHDGSTLLVRANVDAGHKLALQPISQGEVVRKYGHAIGIASAPIEAGEHVHVHNVEVARSRLVHGAGRAHAPTVPVQPAAGERIFRLMLASGQPTLSERHGLGDNEFVPWQLGAVM